jgi:hypothetical protein
LGWLLIWAAGYPHFRKAADKQRATTDDPAGFGEYPALLGSHIYGYDHQNLFGVVRDLLAARQPNIAFKLSPELFNWTTRLCNYSLQWQKILKKISTMISNKKSILLDVALRKQTGRQYLRVTLMMVRKISMKTTFFQMTSAHLKNGFFKPDYGIAL